ncbi:MAG: heat-shock protein HtpX [Cellvibrionales bacterium]|jgi:hypothetical protein
MSTVHIIRNALGHYWGKGKRWVDGSDTSRVAQHSHRDEAVNTVFELSSKDIDLRCDVLEMNLVDDKLPKLNVSEVPLADEDETDTPSVDSTVTESD